jgi:hypothetical protein
MAQVKKEREAENLINERNGTPGDVDFQRMIKQFREQEQPQQELSHTPPTSSSNGKGGHGEHTNPKITICVRKRPVNKREIKMKDYDCITCWHPKVMRCCTDIYIYASKDTKKTVLVAFETTIYVAVKSFRTSCSCFDLKRIKSSFLSIIIIIIIIIRMLDKAVDGILFPISLNRW